jgi:hypothetical protein
MRPPRATPRHNHPATWVNRFNEQLPADHDAYYRLLLPRYASMFDELVFKNINKCDAMHVSRY